VEWSKQSRQCGGILSVDIVKYSLFWSTGEGPPNIGESSLEAITVAIVLGLGFSP
jgi:hypothetical protein